MKQPILFIPLMSVVLDPVLLLDVLLIEFSEDELDLPLD